MDQATFAVDTKDMQPAVSPAKLEIKGINIKIAAALGVGADDILINDFKVSPYSKAVYFAISRGRGTDGKPVILTSRTQGGRGGVVSRCPRAVPQSRGGPSGAAG